MLTVHVMFKSNQENYLDIANQIKNIMPDAIGR